MSFDAKHIKLFHSCSKYSEKAVAKLRRLEKDVTETAHAPSKKSLGWKTDCIGIRSYSLAEKFIMKWIGLPYNAMISKLSIDKSYQGRLLRDQIRSQFQLGYWEIDAQGKVRAPKKK